MFLFPGSTEFLRLHWMVNNPAGHLTIVHIPSFPQRHYISRNLEDHLQGTFGVNSFTHAEPHH